MSTKLKGQGKEKEIEVKGEGGGGNVIIKFITCTSCESWHEYCSPPHPHSHRETRGGGGGVLGGKGKLRVRGWQHEEKK